MKIMSERETKPNFGPVTQEVLHGQHHVGEGGLGDSIGPQPGACRTSILSISLAGS